MEFYLYLVIGMFSLLLITIIVGDYLYYTSYEARTLELKKLYELKLKKFMLENPPPVSKLSSDILKTAKDLRSQECSIMKTNIPLDPLSGTNTST